MKLYSPSNSDSGFWFEGNYCHKCIKYPISPNAKNQCQILGKEICNEPTGKWIYKGHVPICTAFKSRKEANKKRKKYYKPKTDKNQLELF